MKSQPQPLAFADHQTHLALLQTISPGNSESAIVGRQSKSVGRQSPVFGYTALCTTSRGTNRRHRLLGNFSPPARLQQQTATNLWTCYDFMRMGFGRIVFDPLRLLWISVVYKEKWSDSWRQCWQIQSCMKLWQEDEFLTFTFVTVWSQ